MTNFENVFYLKKAKRLIISSFAVFFLTFSFFLSKKSHAQVMSGADCCGIYSRATGELIDIRQFYCDTGWCTGDCVGVIGC
ncbi:MAG: hypothetical protein R2828_05830 [Saprospiraceae bacterium]